MFGACLAPGYLLWVINALQGNLIKEPPLVNPTAVGTISSVAIAHGIVLHGDCGAVAVGIGHDDGSLVIVVIRFGTCDVDGRDLVSRGCGSLEPRGITDNVGNVGSKAVEQDTPAI